MTGKPAIFGRKSSKTNWHIFHAGALTAICGTLMREDVLHEAVYDSENPPHYVKAKDVCLRCIPPGKAVVVILEEPTARGLPSVS